MKKILFLIVSCGLLASTASYSKITTTQAVTLVSDFAQLDSTVGQLQKSAKQAAQAFKSCSSKKGQDQINCLASAFYQLSDLIISTTVGLLGYTDKDKGPQLAIIGDLAQVAGKDTSILEFSKRLTGTATDIKTLATLLNPDLVTKGSTKPVQLKIDPSQLKELNDDLGELEL